MTIQRPTPIRPQIESWQDLQAWIDKRLENIESDLGDDETMQSIGDRGEARLTSRRSELLDVAFAIAPMVAAEQVERERVAAEDSTEAAYKATYGPDADKLATYQAEGR